MSKKTSGSDQKKRKNQAAMLCSGLGIFLLLAVILLCLPLTLPKAFGYQMYHVISGSMEPEIPVGSLLYVRPMEPEQVENGDIIAFYGAEGEDAIVTHRVLENRTLMGEFVTKGDANQTADMRPVPYADMIGQVSITIPGAGVAYAFFVSAPGRAAAVAAVAVALLLQAAAACMEKKK